MAVPHLFENDTEYLQWIEGHPEGYVINCRANMSADYVVLHRANCRTIALSTPALGSMTTGAYRKVGGSAPSILDGWISSNIPQGDSISNECIICKP